MFHKATLDSKAKRTTIIFTIAFAIIIVAKMVLMKDPRELFNAVSLLFLGIYAVSLLVKTSGYKIDQQRLSIKRWLFSVHIDKKDIVTIDRIETWRLTEATRLYGINSLFGYYGQYQFAGYGIANLYVTRRDTMILITTKSNKRIVVSPDHRSKFILELKGLV